MPSAPIITGLLGAGLLVIGLGTLPGSLSNGTLADALTAHGTTVTATAVQVYVSRYVGRGNHLEVDKVRVTMPASGATAAATTEEPDPGQAYELTGTTSNTLDDDPSWVDRWVPASTQTGYTPPLPVKYVLDDQRQVQAMALSDLDTWSGPDQAVESAGLGLLGAALLGGLAFYMRRTRHPGRHRG